MLKLACGIGAMAMAAAIFALPVLADGAGPEKTDGAMRPERPMFSDIDTNKDGMISQAEFDAFRPKGPDGAPGRDHWRDRAHDRGPHGRAFHGPDMRFLDTDKDGKISFDEFIAPMKARFGKLDANHDSFLDETELKAPPFAPEGGPDGNGPPPPPPEK